MNGARRYDAGLFSFVLATWSIFSLKRVPFKLYGLSFRGKSAFFPLASGRAELCRRLALRLFQWQNALNALRFLFRQCFLSSRTSFYPDSDGLADIAGTYDVPPGKATHT